MLRYESYIPKVFQTHTQYHHLYTLNGSLTSVAVTLSVTQPKITSIKLTPSTPTILYLSIDSTVAGSEGSQVSAMIRNGDILYIGGQFATIGIANISNLAAIDLKNRSLVSSWTPNPDAAVHAIALYPATAAANGINANVFIGGDFTTPNKYLAIIAPSGSGISLAWSPSVDGQVLALH